MVRNRKKKIVNMLCARYSYKTDLRVKAQEAYERGEKSKTRSIAKEMLKRT